MFQYELKIKYNNYEIIEGIDLPIAKHTGFVLIKYEINENNEQVPVEVHSIDLAPENGLVFKDVVFAVSKALPENLNSDFFEFKDIGITGNIAVEIFNKIAIEANLINLCSQYIMYTPFSNNCNTSTAYFLDKYVPDGKDVLSAWFYTKYFDFDGSFKDYFYGNAVELISQLTEGLINKAESEEFDFSEKMLTDLINHIPGATETTKPDHFSITLGDITYSVTGGNDSTFELSNGNDIVYSLNYTDRDYVKDVNLGGGSDTYYGSSATDLINGGSTQDLSSDINTVILGEGNDEYVGGIGQDIVYGDEGDDILDLGGINYIPVAGEEKRVDQAFGGSGDDTYIFKKGYQGTTIIDDESGTADKIIFDGLAQDDVKFIKNNKYQIISSQLR